VRVGAVRHGERLVVSVSAPAARPGQLVQFDFARHRRVMNLDRNLVRLNEFPEWFTVDENTLYRVGRPGAQGAVRLGSELIAGITLEPGEWAVERAAPGKPM
jgi:hypothetical protein